jgi:hypothetical protein
MKSKYQKNYTEKGYLMHYQASRAIPILKNKVYQFYIEMHDITPKIWRRIQVPGHYNFWDLHVAIQDAMGWLDCHLHHFKIRGKGKRGEALIGIPDFDRLEGMPEVFPGWEIPVYLYFNDLGVEATYLYDYGDDWMHRVKLEGYMHKEKGVKYPICVGGERACPPEDCGAVPGYYNVLETLAKPKHPDHRDMRTWVGKDYDPERFNPEAVRFDNPHKRWEYAFLKP